MLTGEKLFLIINNKLKYKLIINNYCNFFCQVLYYYNTLIKFAVFVASF